MIYNKHNKEHNKEKRNIGRSDFQAYHIEINLVTLHRYIQAYMVLCFYSNALKGLR